jgi:hypothetical protein
LAYWNIRSKRFVVERDQVQVLVGSSSADIRAKGSVAVN